jgi:nicotinamidase/pyrazinamidase
MDSRDARTPDGQHPNRLRSGAALLLVDVQNDFCPGGALPVPGGDRVVQPLNAMIDLFQAHGQPIYATRDWHPARTRHFQAFGGRWPPHCIAGTHGAELHPDLRLPSPAVVISTGQGPDDDGYSAFDGRTPDGATFEEDLRRKGVSELYVGGLATDYCVRASVLDARRAGFPVTVIVDGIAGITPEDSGRALDEMRDAGVTFARSSEIAERAGTGMY